MHQWEYEKLALNDLPRKTDEIDVLNDAGKDGWELIAITPNNVAILKRPIVRPAAAKSTSRRSTLSSASAK
jgi:hypothetical protein